MEEKKAIEDKVTEIHAVDLLPHSNLSNYSKKKTTTKKTELMMEEPQNNVNVSVVNFIKIKKLLNLIKE